MGNTISEIRQTRDFFPRLMLDAAAESDLIPDVGIDVSLVKYSGLNSAAELENSISQKLKDMCNRIPDFVQGLGSALAALDAVPNAVGLGAVALSIALELKVREQEEKESNDSTLDMLRRVFAEEKASGVRDSMEEYLKRLRMYLHQPSRALEETERLEKQLSEQLTRLKNSMLHDNQMSSRSLKHWTNGAAFHLQMLIHAARLKIQSTAEHEAQLQVHQSSIISVLDSYQYNLEMLLKQYKTYKKSTISLSHPGPWLIALLAPFPVDVILRQFWAIKDKELERASSSMFFPTFMMKVVISSDDYVDYMFDHLAQVKELKSYFSDLKDNIKDLIIQNDEFNMQNILPVSDNQDDSISIIISQ